MAPIQITKTDGGTRYAIPFLGSTSERLSERLDISALHGTDLVDEDGFLIPGSVLRLDTSTQTLLPITSGGQTARGFVFEGTRVAKSNSEAHLNAATDFDVVIIVAGTVDKALAEFNLGREYSANEISAIEAANKFTLTEPES